MNTCSVKEYSKNEINFFSKNFQQEKDHLKCLFMVSQEHLKQEETLQMLRSVICD